MQTFFSWLRNLSMRMSVHQQRNDHGRNRYRHKYGYDALEERRVLTIGLDMVAPPNGNMNADGEWEGVDATVYANVSSVPENRSFRIEIDQNGDGAADASWDQSGQNTQVQFDLRSLDTNLTGHGNVRLRASELDEVDATVLSATDWVDFRYNLLAQGEDNQSSEGGSGEEGSGEEGEPETENNPPTVDSFTQGEQVGDWYVFNGHVGGTYVDGATVTFSGVLGDQSASIDAAGNFSISAYLSGGTQGFAYAQVTDTQGSVSDQVALLVDIPSETPAEGEGGSGEEGSGEEGEPETENNPPTVDSFTQGEQVGDWYVFNGHVGGTYVDGATVTFSGVLGDQSASIDAAGNFSISAYLSGGTQGFAYAQVTDTQGSVSDQVALLVDIPSETPAEGEGGSGEEGSGEEGSGEEGEPETENNPPTVDSFTQGEQVGDWYVFNGHVGGTYVDGRATVTFSGVLGDQSASIDAAGNFSISAYLSGGTQGFAYAQVTDTQGSVSDQVALLVDIPSETPAEGEGGSGEEGSGEEGEPETENNPPTVDSFTQGEQVGDWYVFNGHVGGTYVDGATVTFSGVLGDQSASIDAAGNFSISAYLSGGTQGFAYAQVTDTQGSVSDQVALLVDIPSETPAEGE